MAKDLKSKNLLAQSGSGSGSQDAPAEGACAAPRMSDEALRAFVDDTVAKVLAGCRVDIDRPVPTMVYAELEALREFHGLKRAPSNEPPKD